MWKVHNANCISSCICQLSHISFGLSGEEGVGYIYIYILITTTQFNRNKFPWGQISVPIYGSCCDSVVVLSAVLGSLGSDLVGVGCAWWGGSAARTWSLMMTVVWLWWCVAVILDLDRGGLHNNGVVVMGVKRRWRARGRDKMVFSHVCRGH